MTTLNLEGNNIRAEGAAALASALRVNGVLKSINLRGNSLGTEGWCAIFAALSGPARGPQRVSMRGGDGVPWPAAGADFFGSFFLF